MRSTIAGGPSWVYVPCMESQVETACPPTSIRRADKGPSARNSALTDCARWIFIGAWPDVTGKSSVGGGQHAPGEPSSRSSTRKAQGARGSYVAESAGASCLPGIGQALASYDQAIADRRRASVESRERTASSGLTFLRAQGLSGRFMTLICPGGRCDAAGRDGDRFRSMGGCSSGVQVWWTEEERQRGASELEARCDSVRAEAQL